MNASEWIRQTHRWVSIAFTVGVIVNIVALTQEKPAVWVGLLALLPLAVLLFTGLYLFVLPYALAWRYAGDGPDHLEPLILGDWTLNANPDR